MTNNKAVKIANSIKFISQRARTVYMVLASFSNKNDTCFPSVATIAKTCGLSERTVQRAIADLIAMELVDRVMRLRQDHGFSSNLYTIVDPLSDMSPAISNTDVWVGDRMTTELDNTFNKNILTCSLQTDTRELLEKGNEQILTMQPAPSKNEAEQPLEKEKKRTPELTLDEILENCELQYIKINYGEEFSGILENTIYRLYYSEKLRVKNAVLPQSEIRKSLRYLNYCTLQTAIDKLERNPKGKVKNSSAYLTVLLYNEITETHADWYMRRA